ncbi:LuxR C-terminal-related transcriptional regulator [Gulosibacter faecalis]|jgi:DNA-binding NarL/FixJ family response regulator|nr:LuxR C-terminal-related transcriptional regulator [Gulosibacter faecalis]
MMQRSSVLSEYELLERSLDELKRDGAFPFVFGGMASDEGVQVTALRGQITGTMAGLHVRTTRGLGGRVIAERRPKLTTHYGRSRAITHDYDRAVLGEGVRSLIAVPIEVEGAMRGVIYGASRTDAPLGPVVLGSAERTAAELARRLRARDQVVRARERAADAARVTMRAAAPITATQLELLRSSYAELRAISADVGDDALRLRLEALERRLVGIAHPELDAPRAARGPLSPRELDVLGYVALGWRNAEIGAELGLTESTVKSYLGSVLRKLGEHSRAAAVAAARREGLLP